MADTPADAKLSLTYHYVDDALIGRLWFVAGPSQDPKLAGVIQVPRGDNANAFLGAVSMTCIDVQFEGEVK